MGHMRRRVHNTPVKVRLSGDRPGRFRLAGHEYEVSSIVKMIGLIRAADDIDTRFWVVRARCVGGPESTFELECDHGEWRLVADWEPDQD
jgi:hypothetical protein